MEPVVVDAASVTLDLAESKVDVIPMETGEPGPT